VGQGFETPHCVRVNLDLELPMFRRLMVAFCALSMGSFPATLYAQQPQDLVRQLNRSGPRFGITWLGGSIVDTLRSKHSIDVSPVVTQFGWQFEKQFASLESGPVALNELVLLVGGLDQGAFLPSFSWLVGVRTPGQFEIGVGPNITPAGVALAFSSGMTFRAGALAVPVNVALVPSKYGMRASVLTGFNLYR
jgi:hypothetical protein